VRCDIARGNVRHGLAFAVRWLGLGRIPETPMSNSDCKLACRSRANVTAHSRRALFRLLAAVTVAGATIPLAQIVKAQQVDKKTAKYQDHPNSGKSCSQCRFFRPPKSCQLVEGDISPNGWCSFFSAKT
jgi:hypothetical protein